MWVGGSPGREQDGRTRLSGRGFGFQQRKSRRSLAWLGRELRDDGEEAVAGSSGENSPRTEMSLERLRQQDLRGGRTGGGGGPVRRERGWAKR